MRVFQEGAVKIMDTQKKKSFDTRRQTYLYVLDPAAITAVIYEGATKIDGHYCRTVVPLQVDIFIRWEVWRHAQVVLCIWRNHTLGGKRRGYSQSAPEEPAGWP